MNILTLAKETKALSEAAPEEADSVNAHKKWILDMVNAAPQLADAVLSLTAEREELIAALQHCIWSTGGYTGGEPQRVLAKLGIRTQSETEGGE